MVKLNDSLITITAELLNNYIGNWLIYANDRIHGTTGKKPSELFLEEVKHLSIYIKPAEPSRLLELEAGKKLANVEIIPIKQPPLNIYDSLVV